MPVFGPRSLGSGFLTMTVQTAAFGMCISMLMGQYSSTNPANQSARRACESSWEADRQTPEVKNGTGKHTYDVDLMNHYSSIMEVHAHSHLQGPHRQKADTRA